MNYHIGRMLIDEFFDGSEHCPLCRIKMKVENRLAEQYLGEKVMEDSTRKEVNKLGFCKTHFDLLYSMPSKLGLALQSSTRLKTVYKSINEPKSVKEAKKQAERISRLNSTCVICKYLGDNMTRYYKTVAQIYSEDEKFREKISDGNGFCLEHYSKLIENSSYAGKYAKEYLKNLYASQIKRLDAVDKQLSGFCNHHDYRYVSLPLGENKNALRNYRRTFYDIEEQ